MQTTVSELVAEVLEAKRNDGRSAIYLNDLRNRLAIFCRDFGHLPVGFISTRELAAWQLETVRNAAEVKLTGHKNGLRRSSGPTVGGDQRRCNGGGEAQPYHVQMLYSTYRELVLPERGGMSLVTSSGSGRTQRRSFRRKLAPGRDKHDALFEQFCSDILR